MCTVHEAPKCITALIEVALEPCYSQSITANERQQSIKLGRSLTKGCTALIAVSEIQTSSTVYCVDQVGSDR